MIFVVTIKRGLVFDLMIEAESRSQVLQWIYDASQTHPEKTEVQAIRQVPDLHSRGLKRPCMDSGRPNRATG